MYDIYPSEKLKILICKDHTFIQSMDKVNNPTICFEKSTGSLLPQYTAYTNQPVVKEKLSYGLIGIIKMHSGIYLQYIKRRILGALVDNKRVYKITKTKFICISTPTKITEEKKKIENSYLEALTKLFKKKDFYFSYDYDITNSLQRMDQQIYLEKEKEQLYLKVDDIFFFNHFATAELRNKRFDPFILPIMRGCIQVFTYLINGILCRFELISRRSRHKAGTRYKMRGIDENGFVANYVETEQRLFSKKRWTSLVQTRGSIPLFWEQSGKGYRPTPRIIQNRPHVIFFFFLIFFFFFIFYLSFFFFWIFLLERSIRKAF